MAKDKTTPVSFRFAPRTRELLEAAARHQKRSLTNTVEVLVESYCDENGLLPIVPVTAGQSTNGERNK